MQWLWLPTEHVPGLQRVQHTDTAVTLHGPTLAEPQTLSSDPEYPASSEQCWHRVEQQANPAGHGVQNACCPNENVPCGQATGCKKGIGQYIPGGHTEQLACPSPE